MSIREVTMYAVHCDAEGCTRSTGDAGEYSAWGDSSFAEDEWECADGRITTDRKHYCWDHAERVCLECDREGDPEYIAEHGMCETCKADDK